MTTCDKPEESPAVAHSRTWQAVRRLAAEFPTVSTDDLVGALIDSRRDVELFGLPHDQELAMAEKITAERLRQFLGESAAKAAPRLHTQKHDRRRPSADSSACED